MRLSALHSSALFMAMSCVALLSCGPGEEGLTPEALGTISRATFRGDLGSTTAPIMATGNTSLSTNDFTPTCASSNAPDDSYLWTAPWTGSFTFSTFGSSFDTVLEVRPYNNTTQSLGCNDDANGTLQSMVTVNLTQGQQVLLIVDGYGGPIQEQQVLFSNRVGAASGAYRLNFNGLGSSVVSPSVTSSTCGAPNQYSPSCAYSQASDQTYYWKAPYAGTFTFTTFGANFDTALHIYDDSTGTALGCNDDAGGTLQSSLTLILNSGAQLRIVVDGYGTSCGSFPLNISGVAATWTQWYDRDDPSGSGDWEMRVDQVPAVCAAPLGVQCQTLTGIDWTQTGEVTYCTTEGFHCTNADQPDYSCLDYQVRFLCP